MAIDFHLADNSIQLENISPWVWKEIAVADGLGEYYALSLWAQPIHTFFGLLALMNVPYEIQTKLLGFLIVLIGFLWIWKLLDKYGIKNEGKAVGSIFFFLNSYFLLLFDGGQLSLALAYSSLPAVFYYFLSVLETNLFKDRLKFALAILVLSIFDIRIVYLAILLILFFLIFKLLINFKEAFPAAKNLLLSGVTVSIILIGFHAFWLWPAVVAKQFQLPQTYERVSQIGFLSFSSLQHSILLQQPHWPNNIFGKVNVPRAEFILIPMLAFLVLVLTKRNAIVAFWLSVSVISIFLSKGSNEPFPQVYSFLFTNIPGFSLFRDPTKFYFLTCLSYSILLGFSVQALIKVKIKNLFINKLIKITPFLFIIYLIFLVRPVYLGQMSGLLTSPNFLKEFEQLADIFKNNNQFSRIFWVPMKSPLGYVSTLHPAVGATRLSQKRPFAVGTKGTYETFNFLREAPYMEEIFDVAGIGYIVYPYLDPRRDNMHPDNIKYYYTFLDQLSKRPWLTRIEASPIPLLQTKQHQDRFFITANSWWVIGSDSIYNEATKSAKLALSKNALIFAEEYPGLGVKIDELPEAKIILNNKTDLDLAASFINSSDLIFPAKKLGFEPDKKSGWWKRETVDLVWWRAFLQEKYGIVTQDFDLGGGWAVGENSVKLKVKNEKFAENKVLLVRVLESSRSGSLKFYQGDQVIGEILTEISGHVNVRWFEAGKLVSDQQLTIASEGDINVVNALVVLDKENWLVYQKKAKDLYDRGRIVSFDEKNIQESIARVSYQKVNPTKYQVSVRGLDGPAFLVFSQNFDGLWKLGNQSPLPVYSLLNGFRLERDGDYIVEFEAQKYVYLGLIVSGLTLAILVFLLIRYSKSS